VRPLSTKTLERLEAEGNCVTEGTEESWPPKVGWGATGGEPVGPYERNSIRPDEVASLLANGEARNPMGADGKRPCGVSPEREMKQAGRKRTWNNIGWLETERQGSSDDVNRGYPPCALNERWKSEPSYELRSAVTGVERREAGR